MASHFYEELEWIECKRSEGCVSWCAKLSVAVGITMQLTWKVLFGVWKKYLQLKFLTEQNENRDQANWSQSVLGKSEFFWTIALAPYMGLIFELFLSFFVNLIKSGEENVQQMKNTYFIYHHKSFPSKLIQFLYINLRYIAVIICTHLGLMSMICVSVFFYWLSSLCFGWCCI